MNPTENAALPLEGIRVVDLTRNLAGPYFTMMLGDMGADVIKVEPPTGDETRKLFRFEGRADDSEDLFGMFNRNKRSITLDLKSERGKQVLTELIRQGDVFASNSAPGVVERLGFSYETVREINPRIVYTTVSGFGPAERRRAYDGVVQAASGVMDLTGPTEGPPMPTGLHIGDLGASLFAAFSTTSALLRAQRTGLGGRVDVAMMDSLLALHSGAAAQYFTTGKYPRGSMSNSVYRVPSAVFPTGDGRFVFLIGNNEIWPRLCTALGLEDYVDHPHYVDNQARVANRDEVIGTITDRLMEMKLEDICRLLDENDVPNSAVATLDEALESDYVKRKEMVIEIGPDLRGGREPLRVMGVPYKLSGPQPGLRLGPPKLGEHTDSVISEVMGSA